MRNWAILKCINRSHHANSVNTVSPPSNPAAITKNNDPKESRKLTLSHFLSSAAIQSVKITRIPRMVPISLCEYSTNVWNSNGGINSPWHRGQSGQPNPDSEARTIPPKVIWLNATTRLIEINNFNVVDLEILGLGSLVEIVASLIDSKHCVFFFTNTLIQCYYRENIRSKLTSYRKL